LFIQISTSGEINMATIEGNLFINAPIETVWEYVTQINSIPDWFEGVKSVKSDDDVLSLGTAMDVTYGVAGQDIEMEVKTIEFIPGQLIVQSTKGMLSAETHYQYKSEGDGTRVTAHSDYQISGGLLGKLAEQVVKSALNSNKEKTLQNLKSQCEG